MRRRVFLALGALAAVILLLRRGAGRSLWHPAYTSMRGPRSHGDVVSAVGWRRARLRGDFEAAGVPYPPPRVVLAGFKEEKLLEVWASAGTSFKRVKTYPVLAASGGPGPKRREGDRQVPEGIYRLTGFNPNSSYHLSVRVDYPNAEDRAVARAEGRSDLGGDIFIHGKAVSIGCLAIGDDAIEELYLLLHDAGLSQALLVLSPSADPVAAPGEPTWVAERYSRIAGALRDIGRAARR